MTNPLLVLIGPTAVGKTSLSLHLASKYACEIVSADSRLFYRGMNIGTDKPSPEDLLRVKHHLIDICRPDEIMTLGEYQRLAYSTIANIHKRNSLPILVGGTGQYVKAVVEGWQIPGIPPNPTLRDQLYSISGSELFRWLRYLDPKAANLIHPKNTRRIVRALEVILLSGKRKSELESKKPPDYTVWMIGLTCDRELLYKRIDARIDRMVAKGLLEEIINLQKEGFGRQMPAMSGLGYAQLHAYLDGEGTLADAIQRAKFETHRFVRQQYTWFRPGHSDIIWFDVEDPSWMETVEKSLLQSVPVLGSMNSTNNPSHQRS